MENGRPSAEFVTLDRDTARMLLNANTFYEPGKSGTNVKVDLKLVNAYTKAMMTNDWGVSDQAISLNAHGDLVNGQHRLLAFLECCNQAEAMNMTPPIVTVLLVHDLPVDSMEIIDIGRKRKNYHFLQMQGYKNAFVLSAAAKLIYLYDEVPYTFTAWHDMRITPKECDRVIIKAGAALEEAVTRGAANKRVMMASAISAGIYLTRRDSPDAEHAEFFHKIQSGIGLYQGDPIYALRRFYENLGYKRKTNSIEGLALLIKAFNAFVKGERVDVLSFRTAVEDFPRVVDGAKRKRRQQ